MLVLGLATDAFSSESDCWPAPGAKCDVGSERHPTQFVSLLQHRAGKPTKLKEEKWAQARAHRAGKPTILKGGKRPQVRAHRAGKPTMLKEGKRPQVRAHPAGKPTMLKEREWAQARAQTICMDGHALPQLYLLGPQKAGTTTMASDLFSAGVSGPVRGKHCDDEKNMGCKELHAFDTYCDYNSTQGWPTNGSSCKFLSKVQKKEWAQKFESCDADYANGALLADMTPVNLRLPGLAPVMADLYGENRSSLKFIILLRNPVERMQSGYYFNWRPYGYNFSTWIRSLVMPQAEVMQANGWEAALQTDPHLDQLYRSLMSVQLKQWLDEFDPAQFMLVPMTPYYHNVTFRQHVFRQMQRQWNIILHEPAFEEMGHENPGGHRSLEEDVEPSLIADLNDKFLNPDAVHLFNLLSEAIPRGLTLAGYTGPQDSAAEIGAFLESMDYS